MPEHLLARYPLIDSVPGRGTGHGPLHPHSRGRQRKQAADHRDEIEPDHVRCREDVREVIFQACDSAGGQASLMGAVGVPGVGGDQRHLIRGRVGAVRRIIRRSSANHGGPRGSDPKLPVTSRPVYGLRRVEHTDMPRIVNSHRCVSTICECELRDMRLISMGGCLSRLRRTERVESWSME